jgi:hypothetical protein
MNKTLPILLAAAAAAVSIVAPLPAFADAKEDALQTDRGVAPDVSDQQRYQKAVENAALALKKNLAQCDKMRQADRAECIREANDLHDADMAKASDVLNRPR